MFNNVVDLLSLSVIKDILLKSQVAFKSGKDRLNFFHYRAPNGRCFVIYEDNAAFYLAEAIPDGRRCRKSPQYKTPVYWDDTRITTLLKKNDPNGFLKATQAIRARDDEIARVCAIFSKALPKFRSLDEVVEAILEAIDENRWINSGTKKTLYQPPPLPWRTKAPADPEKQMRERVEYLNKLSQATDPKFFRGLFNTAGPLPLKHRQALQEYMKAPSPEAWREVCDINVKLTLPLWRAIMIVDQGAPLMGGLSSYSPRADELKKYLRKIGEADALMMLKKNMEVNASQGDETEKAQA